jgi:hypothetical protein
VVGKITAEVGGRALPEGLPGAIFGFHGD